MLIRPAQAGEVARVVRTERLRAGMAWDRVTNCLLEELLDWTKIA